MPGKTTTPADAARKATDAVSFLYAIAVENKDPMEFHKNHPYMDHKFTTTSGKSEELTSGSDMYENTPNTRVVEPRKKSFSKERDEKHALRNSSVDPDSELLEGMSTADTHPTSK